MAVTTTRRRKLQNKMKKKSLIKTYGTFLEGLTHLSNKCRKKMIQESPKEVIDCVIMLPKNIFLAQFKIVQIFTIFVRSAPVDISSKIQFSKNCLKLWRNTSSDEWNK